MSAVFCNVTFMERFVCFYKAFGKTTQRRQTALADASVAYYRAEAKVNNLLLQNPSLVIFHTDQLLFKQSLLISLSDF